MWKVNDEYHVEREPYNWVLVHTGPEYTVERGRHKGNVTRKVTKKYYGSLAQACVGLLNREINPEESVSKILESITLAKMEILGMLQSMEGDPSDQ